MPHGWSSPDAEIIIRVPNDWHLDDSKSKVRDVGRLSSDHFYTDSVGNNWEIGPEVKANNLELRIRMSRPTHVAEQHLGVFFDSIPPTGGQPLSHPVQM